MTDSADKEPTMEEILSSIRRIISEEDEETSARPDASSHYGDEDDGDVLELTDAPASHAPAPSSGMVHAVEEEEDDILVLDRDDEVEFSPERAAASAAPEPDLELAGVAAEPAPEPAVEMAQIGQSEDESRAPGAGAMDWGQQEGAMTDRLVGDSAAGAAAGAFARLQRATRVPESSDDKSLETIVRELLRPMLKDWLDANLPSIVEKKVREEVERIARQA